MIRCRDLGNRRVDLMRFRTLAVLGAIAAAVACKDARNDASPEASTTALASNPSVPTPPPSATATSSATTEPIASRPDSVAAQHVLVAYKGAKGAEKTITRTKAQAKTRAEEVRAKALAGEAFESLVATYSEDAGSKSRLGSVGKFTPDKMSKPFSDAAFALKVNGVSDVVETPFGFHVIKRNQ